MSYSGYASKLEGYNTSLESTLTSINNVDFDTWSGSAHDKLTSDLSNLSTGIVTQLDQLTSFVSALEMIDDYDSLVGQIDDVNNRISNLDSEDGLYTSNYSRLANKLSSLKTSRDSTRESINAKLLAIKDKYSSNLSVITFDDIVTRSDELCGISSMKDSMTSDLDMTNSIVGVVDISKYHDNEANGFKVTTGNQTYDLSDSDYDLLCAIVSAESDKSYDDALAVITTILNRCETSNWISAHGTNPVSQATAPNQFVVYQEGYYKSYINGNSPDTVKTAVSDALAGVRNHNYLSFRSNGSTSYSSNMITSTGNRYL